jgi:hypothetical protein
VTALDDVVYGHEAVEQVAALANRRRMFGQEPVLA